MDKVRIAFFSDLHIRDNKIQSQTDFGSPSRWIPKKAQEALNDINPDYIFGLGDLTASGHKKDWLGYKKWMKGVETPIFDLMGNHDRDYTVFHRYNYGEEYFSVLGRVAGTKAVKIGNLIFILISEEHDPEGNKNILTSTIPLKRFAFIKKLLQRYAKNNNVFILSHTLLRGTTALSNDWSFNDIKDWAIISKRFFKIFEEFPVIAHLTGHTHLDYRYQARMEDVEQKRYSQKIGKFVDGRKYNHLPDIYFLNIPCIDTDHGWVGSNFALLRKLGGKVTKAPRSPLRRLYIKLEEKGPPVFDILHKSKVSNILGRPAVYYFDIFPGGESVRMITRWAGANKDVESYNVQLKNPIKLFSKKAEVIAFDLSLRSKKNLKITRDDWFEVPPRATGQGVFSKKFLKPKKIKDVEVVAKNLKSYSASWQKKDEAGWTEWFKNPLKLGRVESFKLKINFNAGHAASKIKNILIKTQ